MQSVASAVPLLPGQAGADRIMLASCRSGARKEAYQDARCRAGIIRETVGIQPAPGGNAAVACLEAPSLRPGQVDDLAGFPADPAGAGRR